MVSYNRRLGTGSSLSTPNLSSRFTLFKTHTKLDERLDERGGGADVVKTFRPVREDPAQVLTVLSMIAAFGVSMHSDIGAVRHP